MRTSAFKTTKVKWLAAVPAAALLLIAGCSSSSKQDTSSLPAPKSDQAKSQGVFNSSTAPATVTALAKAAAQIKSVPGDLTPSLSAMTNDVAPASEKPGCQAKTEQSTVSPCLLGDTTASRTVVLYGDSHATMWSSALDLDGKQAHFKVALIAKPGCPAVHLRLWDLANQRAYSQCDQWHDWAEKKIVSLKPAAVVVTSSAASPLDYQNKSISASQWAGGLSDTLRAVKAGTQQLVVIGDIPYLKQSGPECLAAHESDVQSCSTKPSEAIKTDYTKAEQQAASGAGAAYVDPTPWLCDQTCSAVIGKYGVYHNRFHLTGTYTEFLSNALLQALPKTVTAA